MQKKSIVMFLFCILILSACNNVDKNSQGGSVSASSNQTDNQSGKSDESSTSLSEIRDEKAKILKINTDLEEENGWFIVPDGVTTMNISVEVENVETILFWITPTGTGTWGERTLIGYDIDGNDGWSLKWDFGDRIFHDHITVQALGSDGATHAKETFNVHSLSETNGE